MNNNDTPRSNDLTATTDALTLRSAKKGPSRGRKVLFIAASALGVAAMPGVADQLLSTVGSAVVSTAHAGEPKCNPEILPGYEEEVLALLQEYGVDLPKGVEAFISLFELSEAYDATILRDRQITILVSGEGEVLPAPEGFYVFPDGIIAEIGDGGLIGPTWGGELHEDEGGPWSMCQVKPGTWEPC
jgi:hypothetical protein